MARTVEEKIAVWCGKGIVLTIVCAILSFLTCLALLGLGFITEENFCALMRAGVLAGLFAALIGAVGILLYVGYLMWKGLCDWDERN